MKRKQNQRIFKNENNDELIRQNGDEDGENDEGGTEEDKGSDDTND